MFLQLSYNCCTTNTGMNVSIDVPKQAFCGMTAYHYRFQVGRSKSGGVSCALVHKHHSSPPPLFFLPYENNDMIGKSITLPAK